jgi:hypothetical protein
MSIEFGFAVAALLFLGDIFWMAGFKLSQLGIILIVLLIYKSNKIVSKKVIQGCSLIFIYNLTLNFSNIDGMMNSVFKLSIFMLLVICAFDIKLLDYNKLIKYYIKYASFVSFFWWIQFVAFTINSYTGVNLAIIYDSSNWSDSGSLHMVGNLPRLNSFYSEPSYLGLFLLPIFVIKYLQKSFLSASLILLPIIMTFSLNVYAGLGIFFILNMNWTYKSLVFLIILIILMFLMGLNNYFLHRISVDTDHIDVTLLLYVFHIQSYLISWKSFFLGYGVDNYIYLFNSWRGKFSGIEYLSIVETLDDDELMLKSSPLLVLRLFVEWGYLFLIIVAIAIRKYIFVKSYWIYGLLGLALRDGDYMRPYFLFFLIMHISYVHIRENQLIDESISKSYVQKI